LGSYRLILGQRSLSQAHLQELHSIKTHRFDIGQGKLNRKIENALSNYQNGTGKAQI
jgi:hypothetical protein